MAHEALRSGPCRAAVAAEGRVARAWVRSAERFERCYLQRTRIGTGTQ